ncbi:MAG: hypothetical protein KDC71_22040 [Acidobacteria bacterium]|nr:hypothetical protein [Acidobacteriota bacterium]
MKWILLWMCAFCVFAGEGLDDALKNGKLLLNINFRVEWVDQQRDEDAFATTIRSRLGYQSGDWGTLSFLLEFEGLTDLSNDHYNSTQNGQSQYPVVADPVDNELNRAQLVWKPAAGNQLIIGRQRLKLDNDRFIGNVGWRQLEQTFDALLYQNTALNKTTLTVAYLNNANRIFGANHPSNSDFRLDSFILHANYAGWDFGKLSVFAYFFDNVTAPASSHQDLGFLFSGQVPQGKFFYELSYVTQSDYADGADVIDADYLFAGAGYDFNGHKLSANYEVLGGDGTYGFATPFATLHAFNGWADLFLNTPPAGIQDLYLKYAGKWGALNALVFYHQFKADSGSATYGDELDVQVAGKLGKSWTWGAKAALFDRDTYAVDTRKVWFWFTYNY